MRRSTLITTFFSLCLLAPVGCALDASDDAEDVAETQDELSSAASSLVGRYYDAEVPFGGIGRLSLLASGRYTAHVEAGGRAVCITSPCLLPESGTWNATKMPNGALRLRLRADGEPSRFYTATKNGDELVLTRSGQTQTLRALDTKQCLDDQDCSPNEECGPKLCLMYCTPGDPFCCGPSTCEPKHPPVCPQDAMQCADGSWVSRTGPNCEFAPCPTGPVVCPQDAKQCPDGSWVSRTGPSCEFAPCPTEPSCWGAWLDENGTCRTPADGVYPAECCAGPKCGGSQCAAGEVCCNPLSGICTKPGQVCAF